jgi:hypothetical protein
MSCGVQCRREPCCFGKNQALSAHATACRCRNKQRCVLHGVGCMHLSRAASDPLSLAMIPREVPSRGHVQLLHRGDTAVSTCMPRHVHVRRAQGEVAMHSEVVMIGYADAVDQHIEKGQDGGPGMYYGRIVSVGSSEVVADYHCLPNCSGAPVVDARTGYFAGACLASHVLRVLRPLPAGRPRHSYASFCQLDARAWPNPFALATNCTRVSAERSGQCGCHHHNHHHPMLRSTNPHPCRAL